MNHLLIAGASSFIGTNYLEKYARSFVQIVVFRPRQKVKKGCQILTNDNLNSYKNSVNIAFYLIHDQYDLEKNLELLQEFIDVCMELKIRNVIFLSSFVVYDFKNYDKVDSKTPYSRNPDPYVQIKQRMEKMIISTVGFSSIHIVQPTIVLGSGGNWTRAFETMRNCPRVKLPRYGKTRCNTIHVDELCLALHKIILGKNCDKRVNKYLLNGHTERTWGQAIGLKSSIIATTNKHRYHESFVINLVIMIIYHIPIFSLKLGILKRLLGKKTSQRGSIKEWTPSGLTREVISYDYKVISSQGTEIC